MQFVAVQARAGEAILGAVCAKPQAWHVTGAQERGERLPHLVQCCVRDDQGGGGAQVVLVPVAGGVEAGDVGVEGDEAVPPIAGGVGERALLGCGVDAQSVGGA